MRYIGISMLIILLFSTGCSALVGMPLMQVPNEQPSALVGDAEHGALIFTQGIHQSPPCSTCHQVIEGGFGFSLGPNLAGIAQRAGTRIEGLDSDAYIHQSILDPRSFIVPGYRDMMYPEYAQHFTEQDIADVVAYLMSLGSS